jgi:hypothetical protein
MAHVGEKRRFQRGELFRLDLRSDEIDLNPLLVCRVTDHTDESVGPAADHRT